EPLQSGWPLRKKLANQMPHGTYEKDLSECCAFGAPGVSLRRNARPLGRLGDRRAIGRKRHSRFSAFRRRLVANQRIERPYRNLRRPGRKGRPDHSSVLVINILKVTSPVAALEAIQWWQASGGPRRKGRRKAMSSIEICRKMAIPDFGGDWRSIDPRRVSQASPAVTRRRLDTWKRPAVISSSTTACASNSKGSCIRKTSASPSRRGTHEEADDRRRRRTTVCGLRQ